MFVIIKVSSLYVAEYPFGIVVSSTVYTISSPFSYLGRFSQVYDNWFAFNFTSSPYTTPFAFNVTPYSALLPSWLLLSSQTYVTVFSIDSGL